MRDASMKKEKRRNSKQRKAAVRRLVITCSAVIVFCAAIGAWQLYLLYGKSITAHDGEEHLFYISPSTPVTAVLDSVTAAYDISSPLSLRLHAHLMHYPAEGPQYARTGCYKLPARLGTKQLIQTFRNGWQTPVKVTIRNIRTQGQLSARLASQLMLDSADIATRLADKGYMERFGLNTATAVSLFIPDTYEMYWDIAADNLFIRMKHEYDKFWNDNRLALAAELGYQPWQIATIASIVEEETNKEEDMPIIAGLYMNRLRIGMPLQSCPTVKFALQDFSLRRILNKHLEYESPYNTYRHAGLPPGPIRIPRAKTMDYVLHPVKSNYLFMCASTAFDGTHHFSSTYSEHAAYARRYQNELNKRGIK